MREPENIRDVVDAGADWIGMIFWQRSPRNAIGAKRPDVRVPLVGVFVDEKADVIARYVKDYSLDLVQLHGSETSDYIAGLRPKIGRTKIIKAIRIGNGTTCTATTMYARCNPDYFLFDTSCDCVGGSGKKFDWDMIDTYKGPVPFILSGGIAPNDAPVIKGIHNPLLLGVDLNSRFETAPGMKDASMVRQFISELKR